MATEQELLLRLQVTSSDAEQKIERLKGQLNKMSIEAGKAGVEMQNAMSAGAKKGGASSTANPFAQSSLQIQDFIVQVSNGTSAMTAFGQQAPQLLSAFGKLGIYLGVGAALVPVIVTGIKQLGGMRLPDLDKLSEGVDKSVGSIKDSFSSIEKINLDSLTETFKDANKTARGFGLSVLEVNQVLLQLASIDLSKGIASYFDAAEKAAGSLVGTAEQAWNAVVGKGYSSDNMIRVARDLGITGEEYKTLKEYSDQYALSLNKGSEAQMKAGTALMQYLAVIAPVGEKTRQFVRDQQKAITSAVQAAAMAESLDKARDRLSKGDLSTSKSKEKASKDALSAAAKELEIMRQLGAEYAKLYEKDFSPKEKYDQEMANLTQLAKTFNMTKEEVDRFAESYRKAFFKANDALTRASLDDYQKGLIAVGDAMEKTKSDAENMRGVLQSLEGVKSVDYEGYLKLAESLKVVLSPADAVYAAQVKLNNEQERTAAIIAEIQDKLSKGLITPEFAEQLKNTMGVAKDSLIDVKKAFTDIAKDGIDAMVDSIFAADKSFADFAKNFLENAAKMILKMLAMKELERLMGTGSGPNYGGIFSAIAGIFGGGKAIGGPVSAGRSYLVGERGPELFTPSSGGNITTNNDLRQMGGSSQTINIVQNLPAGSSAETKRAAAQGARQAMGAISASQRFA